ncbi:Uncharacterized protein TCM_042350 [Theobroma cacao]|uniref:Uncharacterized protein n=1 Tax=Theobroma cacao TaxID=3641 RepID=A0A061FKU4_THECC|nr:Uncharacterized protein TCM_042350 [Theobroma cacao]
MTFPLPWEVTFPRESHPLWIGRWHFQVFLVSVTWTLNQKRGWRIDFLVHGVEFHLFINCCNFSCLICRPTSISSPVTSDSVSSIDLPLSLFSLN